MLLWVVIPALNEAENLRVLVPRVVDHAAALSPDARVLVVNDGSTDDTAAVMRELAAAHPAVELEMLRHNMGKAAALRRGFERALEGGADVVVMMDADGQDDPAELPQLAAALEAGADLVTGARLTRRDRFVKRTTSRLYNRTTAVLSGAPGKDFNSGFKMMRAEVAADVAPMLYGEMHRYLTVVAHDLGHRVAEVAVEHHPRMSGSSKYGLARFWRGFADLVTIRFLLSYENRPSHLFGGIGGAALGLGTLVLGYLTVLKVLTGATIGDRPLLLAGVLLVLVGLQLLLFGLLAELVVHARHQTAPAPSVRPTYDARRLVDAPASPAPAPVGSAVPAAAERPA
ncbi:glycosyltransferase family 2 protein [Nocardioides sp. ChNu-153]|uniref:glycosyltransferase family 2 protein n=1 Tax=unclassified Nocardioides TaxID=2615069 RepID=UPI0024065EF1|nr:MULTISPECIES: glycosyltransferase family 2 protein [unclassified Nocardioides]MDF9715925.1 glycosyltransferase family 2 protein [Nocardioides sp. ChNu-99]MDN7122918.1 glycosyltransferase family 2 protein [Nocardioides sp. ChNu-153]